jgi:hypothetical protein
VIKYCHNFSGIQVRGVIFNCPLLSRTRAIHRPKIFNRKKKRPHNSLKKLFSFLQLMSNLLQYTSLDSIQDHVSHVRQIFNTGKPRDLKWRKFQLQRLYDLVSENEERFYEALKKDMNKPRNEAMSGDTAPVLDECLYFLDVSVL